jgi:hypothetical protein
VNKQELIQEITNNSFKNFTQIKLSEGSKKIMEAFLVTVMAEIDKEINLERCLDRNLSIERELINDLEGLLIIPNKETIQKCLDRIREYK